MLIRHVYTAPLPQLCEKGTGSVVGDNEAPQAQTRVIADWIAAFDWIAPAYDGGGPGGFAHYGWRLVEEVGVQPGHRVLDIATGRGAVLFPAAEAAGSTGSVVGIDLAQGMVRATSAEVVRRGLRADVRVMDATQLDFPDASFDRVLCGFAIQFFPDPVRVLGEYRRVLKPGGRIGVSTWRNPYWAHAEGVLDQLMAAPPSREETRTRDTDELAHALASAGFAQVRVEPDPALFRYADVEEYWQSARGTLVRRLLDALDEGKTAQAKALLAERLRPYQREDGFYVEASALIAVASR
jgi:ubiquinone/menaquinone biosynthesis C-methylase UbiE